MADMEKVIKLCAGTRGWRRKLIVSATKEPRALVANVLTALRSAPEWHGVLAHDEFALTVLAVKPPPWCRAPGGWASLRWSDRDDVLTAEWLQHQGIHVAPAMVAQAVVAAAKENPFHPVRDYLHGLTWDGRNRLEGFAASHLGAEDSRYSAAVGRCVLVAAVARIMAPGCKADHIPILEGEQGTLKSTTLDAMFSPWFSDDLSELGTKDAQMQMSGVWCLEIAELTSMRKADVERVKAFASRRIDRYRPSYGRYVIEGPRQCVFIVTTNSEGYLKDESGGRRFWPVRCGRIDIDAVKRDRDQLWAEAVALYREGEPWWLTDAVDIAAACAAQDERYASDAWADLIGAYVEDKDEVSVSGILEHAVGKPPEQWTQVDQNRVAAFLKAQRCWRRGRGPRPLRPWVYRRTGASGAI